MNASFQIFSNSLLTNHPTIAVVLSNTSRASQHQRKTNYAYLCKHFQNGVFDWDAAHHSHFIFQNSTTQYYTAVKILKKSYPSRCTKLQLPVFYVTLCRRRPYYLPIHRINV